MKVYEPTMIIPMTFDLFSCASIVEGLKKQLIKVDDAKIITLRVEHGYYYWI